jgi:hypothetical protein
MSDNTLFQKKAAILGGIAGALALVYMMTFVFDRERAAQRHEAYRWLQPQNADLVDRIEVRGPDTADATGAITLEKAGGTWSVVYEDQQYPAKQSRVDDLLSALTRSGAYAARGASRDIQEKLGLTDDQPSRITVSSGGNALLTLLVGAEDASGSSIHLRKLGEDTVRGGEDRFTPFIQGARSTWEDLRLFPDENGARLNADSVQRFTVFPPPDAEGNPQPHFTLARSGKDWQAETTINNGNGNSAGAPKTADIDAYIRGIIDASGDDFAPGLSPADEAFAGSAAISRVILELGDGTTLTLTQGPVFSEKKTAALSGTPYVWLLSDWTANRIFRTADGLFETEAAAE